MAPIPRPRPTAGLTTARTSGPRALAAGLSVPMLLLAGCGTADEPATGVAESTPPSDVAESAPPSDVAESATTTPRLALTHDTGIWVLDATTLETVGSTDLDGFNRLNPAGDGRHVVVSTSGGFQLLDLGVWAEPHGDHDHYYVADPTLTDVTIPAETPGHVVSHGGRTALFDDGTGAITVADSDALADPDREARELSTPEAHHGVAVERSDDSLVVSEGDEDARTGVRILDADGEEIAASDACPGVHGEAVAADEVVLIGCEDGVLLVTDDAIEKIDSPDPYGRIGNQAGSETSPVVLGDYKTDADAELERPTRVSLTDTRSGELTLVELPSSYSFRSLGRGPEGEALVLGTDGALHVIDPEQGALVASFPVVEPWEEPTEWQQPRPTLFVQDGTAYVTEPASSELHAVDVETGEVWNSVALPGAPNELTGVPGTADEHHGHDHDDEHADHEHDADEHGADGHEHEPSGSR